MTNQVSNTSQNTAYTDAPSLTTSKSPSDHKNPFFSSALLPLNENNGISSIVNKLPPSVFANANKLANDNAIELAKILDRTSAYTSMNEDENSIKSPYAFNARRFNMPENGVYKKFTQHVNDKRMNIDQYFSELSKTDYNSNSTLDELFDMFNTVDYGPDLADQRTDYNFNFDSALTKLNNERENAELPFVNPVAIKKIFFSLEATDAAIEYNDSDKTKQRLKAQELAWGYYTNPTENIKSVARLFNDDSSYAADAFQRQYDELNTNLGEQQFTED